MKVLIACEFSGIVRDAFLRHAHDAISCDLLPSESDGPHLQCDLMSIIDQKFDIIIAFPPCTHLSSSGARYWPEKQRDGRQKNAIDFFLSIANTNCPKIAIENPVGIMGTCYRKPDQIIHPWQFGDPFNKKTCLWLKGLPKLNPTNIVEATHNWGSNSYRSGSRKLSNLPSIHWFGKERSYSFKGIAEAMAAQWGAQ